MSIPHLPEIKIALWQELEQAEGTSEAQDIIERLAQRFQLTQTEREQRNPAGNKTFDNRVHSAVQQSREVDWMETWQESGRSIWKLTLKGRQSVPIYFLVSPPHGHEEIEEELQKRFKAVDDAIDKLKEFILRQIPKED